MPEPVAQVARRRKGFELRLELRMLVLTLILLVALSLSSKYFLTYNNIMNVLDQSARRDGVQCAVPFSIDSHVGRRLLTVAMDRFIVQGQLMQTDADQLRIRAAEVQPPVCLIAIQDAGRLPHAVHILALFGT